MGECEIGRTPLGMPGTSLGQSTERWRTEDCQRVIPEDAERYLRRCGPACGRDGGEKSLGILEISNLKHKGFLEVFILVRP